MAKGEKSLVVAGVDVRRVDDIVGEAAMRLKMSRVELVESVFKWFGAQDDTVQRLIVGHIPAAIAGDVARMILERMADSDSKPGLRPKIAAKGG